jgi:recombination protein RecR
MNLPSSVQNLIDQFSTLPGIGPKTASRLVFYLLAQPEEKIVIFGQAVLDLKKKLTKCSICHNISEKDPCNICDNEKRDKSKVLVVEEPLDVVALEKAGWKGVYHVLGGAISPINDMGPENLEIDSLLDRLKKNKDNISKDEFSGKDIKEIILATNPDLEGEATAMYIWQRLKPFKVKITRIARGLPVGGDLEYADEVTLSRALEGRKDY